MIKIIPPSFTKIVLNVHYNGNSEVVTYNLPNIEYGRKLLKLLRRTLINTVPNTMVLLWAEDPNGRGSVNLDFYDNSVNLDFYDKCDV